MKIKINVKAQINIDIGLLLNFQGDFKRLSEENHMKLRNEIIEDGFNFAPHVWKCDKHYYILDGHQRIYVMNQLLKAGYLFEHADGEQGSMLPCNLVVADTISSAKRKVLQASSQYGKIDTQGFEDFVMDVDFEFDNFDLGDFEIPDFGGDEEKKENEGNTDPDEVPEVDDNPYNVQKGDVWILGNHRLMCGDSTNKNNVDILIDGNHVDMVFTDPPYGIGLVYNTHNDSEEKWYQLIDKIMPIVLKYPFVLMPSCRIKSLGWWYKNYNPDWIMCWYKGSPGHQSTIGFNDWEPHLIWGKPKNCMHDYFQTRCGFQVEGHPCPKPVEYCDWVITRAIDYGDKVLDLFLGSGTTLISCEKNNRVCFGMEIDPFYCSIIIKRWEDFTGKKAFKS